MYSLTCVASFLLLLLLGQVTQGWVVDPDVPLPQPCCYGDETFEHGQVVLSLQRACLQLVCEDGQVVRRYLGEPGERDCCEFDGQLYFESAELTSHCITLQCRDSCWYPTSPIADCCSRCTFYDNAHYHTFDGHHFDFHGVCNYSMAQSGYQHDPEVGIFSDYEECFGKGSCLSHTTFRNDPHTVITLSNGAVFDMLVNGYPFTVPLAEKVYAVKSAEGCHPVLAWRSPWGVPEPHCLTIFGSSRLVIQHCPHRMDILAHPSHTDNLDGLCGHFNFHVDDDMTSRGGQVYPLTRLPLGFPTSWRTNIQSNSRCQAPCRGCNVDVTTDPCTASYAARQQFLQTCNTTLHHVLSSMPQFSFHLDDCVSDLCIIDEYGDYITDIEFWLKIILKIVEMSVFLHLNTEGSELGPITTIFTVPGGSITAYPTPSTTIPYPTPSTTTPYPTTSTYNPFLL